MTYNSRFPHMNVQDEPVYKSELTSGLGYCSGIFSQTSDSLVVTNTTLETSLIDGGVGNLSIPANTFKVGSSYLVKIGGLISCQNGDSLILKSKSNGSVILGSTGSIVLKQATNKVWQMEINLIVRSIGVSGQASIKSHFFFHTKKILQIK